MAAVASLFLGQDANWDLQNYHYYNPWAWWNGRTFDRDIAAAQLQTFHNPLLDMPFFAMVQWDWPPQAIAFALAIPQASGAFFLAKLLPSLCRRRRARAPDRDRVRVSVGVTGAMGIAALGTTMNEWPLAAIVMAGLWIIVRALARTRNDDSHARVVVAGALVGAAAGGKLTAATFAVALCVALLVRFPLDRSTLPSEPGKRSGSASA